MKKEVIRFLTISAIMISFNSASAQLSTADVQISKIDSAIDAAAIKYNCDNHAMIAKFKDAVKEDYVVFTKILSEDNQSRIHGKLFEQMHRIDDAIHLTCLTNAMCAGKMKKAAIDVFESK